MPGCHGQCARVMSDRPARAAECAPEALRVRGRQRAAPRAGMRMAVQAARTRATAHRRGRRGAAARRCASRPSRRSRRTRAPATSRASPAESARRAMRTAPRPTIRPPTTVSSAVVSTISSSAHVKKSRSGTIRSASCPTAMRPFFPSSFENHVTYSVHMRSAVSRSSRLRCGYIRIRQPSCPSPAMRATPTGCTTPPASRRCRPTP